MDCKPAREVGTWKLVSTLCFIISLLILIGVAVANSPQIKKPEPTLKPELTLKPIISRISVTTYKKIPNLSWKCADKLRVFNLDDSIKVCVCKDLFVDIRVWKKGPTRIAARFNITQWRTFLTNKEVIEQGMGIFRIDEKIAIFRHQTPLITLNHMVNGIRSIKHLTVTQKQWLQLINMTKKINNVLDMKHTNGTRQQ